MQLQIWDTAGHEKFRTITQSYYRSANGIIVGKYNASCNKRFDTNVKKTTQFSYSVAVYDITKRSTFLSLQRWVEEVRRYTSSHVVLILVGQFYLRKTKSLFRCISRLLIILLKLKFKFNLIILINNLLILSSNIYYYLGNKCDLDGLREVEKDEAQAVCRCLPEILHVVETSAKENTNIDTIFYYMASELKVS